MSWLAEGGRVGDRGRPSAVLIRKISFCLAVTIISQRILKTVFSLFFSKCNFPLGASFVMSDNPVGASFTECFNGMCKNRSN